MNELLQRIKKYSSLSLQTALAALLVSVSLLPASSAFAYGPERPTYTIQAPSDHVTFNSITNNPAYGDERNFLRVRESTAGNETYADSISVNAGKEYVVYLYYHNNAAANLNASGVGVAKDAYARATIPAIVKNGGAATTAMGYVGASNASPQQVYDDIAFKNTTGSDVALRYVTGSTTIHNFGATNGATMPDTILDANGVKLGYNSLNGTLNGCNDFAGYITFRVKADQPSFDFSKQVRASGTAAWSESVNSKPGDKVDYLLTYKNTGTVEQKDVVIKDVLPKGLTYVNGSTKLANSASPSGAAVGDGIGGGGLNIGNYGPGATAYLTFSAQVAKSSELVCGVNTLKNTASSETTNGNKQDTAQVVVTQVCAPNECKPGIPKGDKRCSEKCVPTGSQTVDKDGNCITTAVTTLPKTGPGQVVVLFVLLAAAGGVIHYTMRRRNQRLTQLAAAVMYENPAVLDEFIAQNHMSTEEVAIAREEFTHLHPGAANHGNHTTHHVAGHAPGHVVKPHHPKE